MYTKRRMKKSPKNRWTRKRLIALGIPAVLIPGILVAITLGWNPTQFKNTRDYYAVKSLFPKTGIVQDVYDGDTFVLNNDVEVRLIGVNAPERGAEDFQESRGQLSALVDSKRVYLEYDRYQDDKYGRVLAWVWVECEKEPTLKSADYMHLTYNASRPGLTENPEGCKKGKLVQEEMVKTGLAKATTYKERGELKYEKRIMNHE